MPTECVSASNLASAGSVFSPERSHESFAQGTFWRIGAKNAIPKQHFDTKIRERAEQRTQRGLCRSAWPISAPKAWSKAAKALTDLKSESARPSDRVVDDQMWLAQRAGFDTCPNAKGCGKVFRRQDGSRRAEIVQRSIIEDSDLVGEFQCQVEM